MLKATLLGTAVLLATAHRALSQNPVPIDLPTALRLAGAQNLDVQIAREKMSEARANHEIAREQFFPWKTPGLGYRRHDGKIQDVGGNIIDASKQAYVVGGSVLAQLDLGDAYFKTLVAKQIFTASREGFDAQRQASVQIAALGYFDLLKAQSAVDVAREALKISDDYSGQVQRAVEIGLAFQGDALRAKVQSERDQLALRQAQEQQRTAAARLAQSLHLDATVELVPLASDLAPISLIPTNSALDSLVSRAVTQRPELREVQMLVSAARDSMNGVRYGPLIPAVGAQAFLGGFGGGRNSGLGNFGDSEDYSLGLSWKIGPGGIFDQPRIRASESRFKTAQLGDAKLRDEITRQVVESLTRMQSLGDQLATTAAALKTATELLRLTRDRKEYAVGIVLENIQSEQELTRARNDYLGNIAEFNKSQYNLARAVGMIDTGSQSSGKETRKTKP